MLNLAGAAVLLAHASAQTAPSFAGDWEGALDANGTRLRLAVHLKSDGKQLTGAMASLDQGAMGIPIETGTVEGSTVHFEVASVKGSFEGTVNGDASELGGTWTQGAGQPPLILKRATAKAPDSPSAAAKPVPLSQSDRDFLVNYLQKTRREFLASIEGLNNAQWSFKAGPDRRCIGECAEHIIASEKLIFTTATVQVLKTPVDPARPVSTREQDERVISGITDRSKKTQAPEPLKPHGTLPSPAEAATQFNAARDHTIEYVKTTQDDLRAHATPSNLFKTMDAYSICCCWPRIRRGTRLRSRK